MAESRQNINIELGEGNKERLEQLRSWNGMTQKEMVGRVINWFCTQDRVIQQIVLGQIPEEIAPDVASVLLNRMAERSGSADRGGRSDASVEAAADAIVGERDQPRTTGE